MALEITVKYERRGQPEREATFKGTNADTQAFLLIHANQPCTVHAIRIANVLESAEDGR